MSGEVLLLTAAVVNGALFLVLPMNLALAICPLSVVVLAAVGVRHGGQVKTPGASAFALPASATLVLATGSEAPLAYTMWCLMAYLAIRGIGAISIRKRPPYHQ